MSTGEILHPRREIRDSVFQILKDKISDVKSFSKNRFRPYWPAEELPAISIYTLTETSEIYDTAPRNLKRTLTLAVEVIVQDDESSDDIVDKLCLEVENAIHVDETLGSKASDCVLTGTEMIQKKEGDTLTASAILQVDVKYFTDAPAQQDLKDYKGADFTMKVGDNQTPDLLGKADVVP